MAGLAPSAERALRLLGAMMLGLQAQGLQVSPLARYQGMEAVLLTLHVCPPFPAEALVAGVERLGRTGRALEKALAEPPDRILVALRQAAGVRAVLAAAPARSGAVMVPSFDDEAAGPKGRRPRRAGR